MKLAATNKHEWLTLPQFCNEVGFERDTVIKEIIDPGLVKYRRLNTDGGGHYRIREDWAKEYLKTITFGGNV